MTSGDEFLRVSNQVFALVNQARFDEALALSQAVLPQSRLIDDDELVGAFYANMGAASLALGRVSEAETSYQASLMFRRRGFGDRSLPVAESLINLAEVHRARRDFDGLERLLIEAIAILAEHPDARGSPARASALDNLGTAYLQTRRLGEAVPLQEEASRVWHDLGDEYEADVATNLHNRALVSAELGDIQAAHDQMRRAIEIRRRRLGAAHPLLAVSLQKGAVFERALGDFVSGDRLEKEALDVYGRVLDVRREALGDIHPEIARTLLGLGILHLDLGNLRRAKAITEGALEIARTAIGPDAAEAADALNNLGEIARQLGNLSQAESLLNDALSIRTRIFGELHPDVATTLNNLAQVLAAKGEVATAAHHLRQALSLRRDALGTQHALYAQSLNNLAWLELEVGDPQSAVRLLREALDLRVRLFGNNHLDVAVSRNNLAAVLEELGERVEAEAMYRGALETWTQQVGPDHPLTATALSNLGKLHLDDDLELAASELQRAFDIREELFPVGHPYVAAAMNDMGLLHWARGEFTEAKAAFEQALSLRQANVGDMHPAVAGGLRNLAGVLAASGEGDEAILLLARAAAIDDAMLGQVFTIGSERQRETFASRIWLGLELMLSVGFSAQVKDHRWHRQTIDLLLRRKGIAAESLLAQYRHRLIEGDASSQDLLAELAEARASLFKVAMTGPGQREPLAHQRDVSALFEQLEKVETDLAARLPDMALEKLLREANAAGIIAALPKDSAVIEYVKYRRFNFEAGTRRIRDVGAHYAGYALVAGQHSEPTLVDLGPAEPIDSAVAGLIDAIRDNGTTRKAFSAEDVRELGSEVGKRVLEPMLPFVSATTKMLFVAPDGELTRVPFEALPVGASGLLVDYRDVAYASTARDILRSGVSLRRTAGPALVVADPKFSVGRWWRWRMARRGGSRHRAGAAPAGLRGPTDRGRATRLRRLRGTRDEAAAIARLLVVDPLLGADALETRVKAAVRPWILHVATHGLFLENLWESDPDAGHDETMESPRNRMAYLRGLPDPMIRSGLALTGINEWLRGRTMPPQTDDGLLAAAEIADMDLSATQLVVASACDTGRGDIRVGEGVFGLQRAVAIAGAETLVMSLWKVPDRETAEFMISLYRGLLNGRSRVEAMRLARLELREKYPAPFYWAAFIAQGHHGPLRIQDAAGADGTRDDRPGESHSPAGTLRRR